jgi:hypothetical protein
MTTGLEVLCDGLANMAGRSAGAYPNLELIDDPDQGPLKGPDLEPPREPYQDRLDDFQDVEVLCAGLQEWQDALQEVSM